MHEHSEVVASKVAQFEKLREANENQRQSIGRLQKIRVELLGILFELWTEVEMPRQAAQVHAVLKEAGYDV